jgi:F-type H+-transporting ATPase subunit b
MELIWQQIVTHALGFLIVVWLLKKYAWGPVMEMLEERREKIVGDFREIELRQQDVRQQEELYQQKIKEIEAERRQKLLEGVNEGQRLANELKSNAQTEAKEIISKSKEETVREVAKAKVQLKKDMVEITMSAAEKILAEKLNAEKDRELVAGFIEKLEKV